MPHTTSRPVLRRWAITLMGLALLQGLAACADLRPLGPDRGAGAHGSWLELDQPRMVEVSPGIRLELPDSPYRARFEDEDGVYYQASMPLVYRTRHGVVNAVAGGLYVRHGHPSEAMPWFRPTLGAFGAPDSRPIRVRVFKPA